MWTVVSLLFVFCFVSLVWTRPNTFFPVCIDCCTWLLASVFPVFQVVMATTGLVGSVMLIASVHKLGKRSISLASTAICAVSFLLLGLYAYLFIIPSTLTADDTYPIPTWVPLVLFAVLSFANTIQGQIPWILITEIFPYRYVTKRLLLSMRRNLVCVVRDKFST